MESKMSGMTSASIKALRFWRDNPRKDLGEGLDDLVSSIKANGILSPLHIRPYKPEPGCFEVIDGNRRLKAAQTLGLKEVPVIELAGDEFQAAQVSLVMQIQRKDLLPVEEAEILNRIEAGLPPKERTLEKVGAMIGKSPGYVRSRRLLTNLSPEAVELMRKERLPISLGISALAIPAQDQVKFLKAVISRDGKNPGFHTRAWSGQKDFMANSMQNLPWDPKAVFCGRACDGCDFRTSTGKYELFGVILDGEKVQDEDYCLDPECYARKVHVMLDEKRGKLNLQKDGMGVLKVTDYVSYEDRQREATPDCKAYNAFLDPTERKSLIFICADKSCKNHKQADTGNVGHDGRTTTERRKAEKERRRNHAEYLLRQKVASEILLKGAKAALRVALLHAADLFLKVPDESRAEAIQAAGLTGSIAEKKEKGRWSTLTRYSFTPAFEDEAMKDLKAFASALAQVYTACLFQHKRGMRNREPQDAFHFVEDHMLASGRPAVPPKSLIDGKQVELYPTKEMREEAKRKAKAEVKEKIKAEAKPKAKPKKK